MLRFAANLSMMYTEHAFVDRFAAAARDGFKAVEFLFPYEYPAETLRQLLADNGLEQALFNAPPGDWAGGERGLASLPGREEDFKRSIDIALDTARLLGNKKLHVMAGLIRPEQDRARHRAVYLENLAYAARLAAAHGVTVTIEPINTRDMPGFFLNRQDEAQAICAEVAADNLQVQFDLYHCQITEGDLAVKLQRDMARQPGGAGGIGHLQIAGVPERHEPDVGEINYPYLFALIDSLGYSGWIGCEYRPRAGTSAGLAWLQPWL
ncbi:2-oxo-tetronate isomerase [Herminiimonas sp. CN]|uniref:2-oxo-tetronate isomerase n=1 Tax=Herminiimonas sp. CN TaxID=1349818 RepID=UPI00047374E7|nr:2-oxo-tetronate isomerase [Herminiimonas sp. CN]